MSLNLRTKVAIGFAALGVIGASIAHLSRIPVPYEEALQVRNIVRLEGKTDYRPFLGLIYTKSFPIPSESKNTEELNYKVFLFRGRYGEGLAIESSGSSTETGSIGAVIFDGNPPSEDFDGNVNRMVVGNSANILEVLNEPPIKLEGSGEDLSQIMYAHMLNSILERNGK